MVKTRELHPKPIFDEPALHNFLSRYGSTHAHMIKIWRHLLAHPECPLDEIPGIPTKIRKPLKEEFVYTTSTVANVQESALDGTVKLLIRLQDGAEIEAVLIHHSGLPEDPDARQADRCGERDTLCISSQVGCRLGCTFCATGTMGLQGNLWAGEIQEQLVHARKYRSVSNIVFMGMGEPLENYESVSTAIKGLVDNSRFAMAPRSITVSTVGILGNMRKLMEDLPKIKLAVSLHAPNQQLREQIVPAAKTYKLDSLMEVVDEYTARLSKDTDTNTQEDAEKQYAAAVRKRKLVMISYVLLEGVNDTDECAFQLRDLVKGRPVIVNLIPYNPFDDNEHDYKTPSPERVNAFLKKLEEADVRVFTRQHHGRDIAAACGQLANRAVDDIENFGAKVGRNGGSALRAKRVKQASNGAGASTFLSCSSKAAVATIAVGMLALTLMRHRAGSR